MGRTNPAQVPTTSLDIAGLSVATASQDPGDDRMGRIYEPVSLGAGQPIYFHQVGPSLFVAVFSERWTDATASTTQPGFFTAFTSDTTPSWVLVNGNTGHKDMLGVDFTIPTNIAHDTRKVVAGCSRADVLYLLNTFTLDGVDTAVLQSFRRGNSGLMLRITEEVLPTIGADLIFNRGLFFSTPFLYFFGSDGDNKVYMARKPWARIGHVKTDWEFQTVGGWSVDTGEIASVKMTSGSDLLTVGPISVGTYMNRRFITAVQASGSDRSAQLYESQGMAWRPTGSPVALGVEGTTYLGGTLYIQAQLGANPADPVLTNPQNSTAFPAVVSVKDTVTSEDTISTTWSLVPVSRPT